MKASFVYLLKDLSNEAQITKHVTHWVAAFALNYDQQSTHCLFTQIMDLEPLQHPLLNWMT